MDYFVVGKTEYPLRTYEVIDLNHYLADRGAYLSKSEKTELRDLRRVPRCDLTPSQVYDLDMLILTARRLRKILRNAKSKAPGVSVVYTMLRDARKLGYVKGDRPVSNRRLRLISDKPICEKLPQWG